MVSHLKSSIRQHLHHDEKFADVNIVEDNSHVTVTTGSDALALAVKKEKLRPRSKRALQLYAICFVTFFCSTLNGFDGSLMSSILVMHPFQREFGASFVGIKAAYITAMYQIGSVVALPFVGPALDTWGRRVGMAIGCGIVVIGTVIQGTSSIHSSIGQFLAGRFLLGFGNAIAATAGPTFVCEMAHPLRRGFYDVGSIISGGTTRGTVQYSSNASWLIPTWMQMACPSITLALVMFLPETPRWLFTHGKQEEAKAILTKYHGDDNPDSVYVTLQLEEFNSQLELDGADKRWWDYRALIKTRGAVYRLVVCNLLFVFLLAYTSGGLSYYVGGFYQTAGITNPTTILNLNLGNSVLSAACSIFGASFCDRIGRRKVMLSGFSGLVVCWIGIIACTGTFAKTGSVPVAKAGIAFNFIFGMKFKILADTGVVFSAAFTPLQTLYPVEVLAFEQRAKGMAVSSLLSNAAGLVTQFATPIALPIIGWKLYIVFGCWTAFAGVMAYFFFVETKGRTLEELDAIFEAKNPRKESLRKRVIVTDDDVNVVEVKQLN